MVLIAATTAISLQKLVFPNSYVIKANDVLKFSVVFIAYGVNLVETFFRQEKYEWIYQKLKEFERVCAAFNVKFSKCYKTSRIYFCKKFMF